MYYEDRGLVHVVPLLGLDESIKADTVPPAMHGEIVNRVGSLFTAGVEFGMRLATTVNNDPLADPRPGWQTALNTVRAETDDDIKSAHDEAASMQRYATLTEEHA
jgi:hypothetical protein